MTNTTELDELDDIVLLIEVDDVVQGNIEQFYIIISSLKLSGKRRT